MDAHRNQLVDVLKQYAIDKDVYSCVEKIDDIIESVEGDDNVRNVFKKCSCPCVKDCTHYDPERCVDPDDFSCPGYDC